MAKCDTCRQELPALKQGDKVRTVDGYNGPVLRLGVIRIVGTYTYVVDFETGDMRVVLANQLVRVHGYIRLEREETVAKASVFAESYGGILRNAF